MAAPVLDGSQDQNTLARGSWLNLFGIAVSGIAGLGMLLVLSRGLGSDGAGAFFEAMALFNIAIVVAAAGCDTGLVRFVARWRGLGEHWDLGHLLRVALIPVSLLGLLIATAGIALSGRLGDLLGSGSHTSEVTTYIRFMAMFVPAGGLYLALLGASRGFETMLPTVALERVGRNALQLVVAAIAVAAGITAAQLATGWGLVVVACLGGAAVWVVYLDRSRRRALPSRLPRIRVRAQQFWAFTLPRSFASIFRVAVLWSDVVIVGALLSPRAAGIYVVATRLLQFGAQIAEAVGQATEPMFSRLLANGATDRVRELYRTATSWVLIATWPQYLAALVFATPVLGLFGTDFTEGASAVAILAVSAMIGSGMGPVDVLLLMAGKSVWSFWNTAASLTVNVGLNLLLIPALGLPGAALSWAVSRTLANALPLAEVSFLLGIHPFGAGWRAAAAASLGTFGVVGVLVRVGVGATLPGLLLYAALAVAGYVAVLYRLRGVLALGTLWSVVRPSRRKAAGAAA